MSDQGGFDVAGAFQSGLDRMSAALGPDAAAAVVRERDRADQRGDRERVELPVALTWGWLMGRPGLSERDRVLAMLGVDIARGSRRALAEHLQLARSVGVSDAELRELFLHLGPYAGYPTLNDAWETLATHLRGQAPTSGAAPASTASTSSPGAAPNTGWLGVPAALVQVSIVVRDAYSAAQSLAQLIGITDWQTALIDGDRAELLVDGRAQAYETLRAVGQTDTGVRIELLEPHRGATPVHLRLLTLGNGIVSLVVAEVDDDERQPLATRAAAAGVTPRSIWQGASGASRCSFATRGLLGYDVEVVSPSLARFDADLGGGELWHFNQVGSPLVPLAGFGHFGTVIPDIEGATRQHARAFGRQRWSVLNFSTEDGSLTDMRYLGAPASEAYLSTVAKVGGFAMEIIEPTTGPSRYIDGFLIPRGPGIQHLFFGPVPDPGKWDDLVTSLADHGYPLVTCGRGWDGAVEYAYVDGLSEIGFDIELVRMLENVALATSERAVFTFDHGATS